MCTDLPEGLSPNIFDIILGGTPAKDKQAIPKSPKLRGNNVSYVHSQTYKLQRGAKDNAKGKKAGSGRKEGGRGHSRNASRDTNIPVTNLHWIWFSTNI